MSQIWDIVGGGSGVVPLRWGGGICRPCNGYASRASGDGAHRMASMLGQCPGADIVRPWEELCERRSHVTYDLNGKS